MTHGFAAALVGQTVLTPYRRIEDTAADAGAAANATLRRLLADATKGDMRDRD